MSVFFSLHFILFAHKLGRLHAKLTFPPSIQTWKKYVFLRYLLNYAYDFDYITPTDLKCQMKSWGHGLRWKI